MNRRAYLLAGVGLLSAGCVGRVGRLGRREGAYPPGIGEGDIDLLTLIDTHEAILAERSYRLERSEWNGRREGGSPELRVSIENDHRAATFDAREGEDRRRLYTDFETTAESERGDGKTLYSRAERYTEQAEAVFAWTIPRYYLPLGEYTIADHRRDDGDLMFELAADRADNERSHPEDEFETYGARLFVTENGVIREFEYAIEHTSGIRPDAAVNQTIELDVGVDTPDWVETAEKRAVGMDIELTDDHARLTMTAGDLIPEGQELVVDRGDGSGVTASLEESLSVGDTLYLGYAPGELRQSVNEPVETADLVPWEYQTIDIRDPGRRFTRYRYLEYSSR